MRLELREIINAVGGRVLGEIPETPLYITSISTDTRSIAPDALFIPLAGENFDGHEFIGQAAASGAVCALTERAATPIDAEIPLIFVKSTRRALMDLADFYRRRHNVKVVAVTGSAGKTTTKDMIADICAQKFRTKRTIKNFNNDIGMPHSIFQLEPEDEVLVLEMGMNHAGEVHALSLVGAPDIAVTTYIGDEHMENFANREGVLLANLEVADGLRADSTLILNGDDPLLTGEIAAEKLKNHNVLYPSGKNIISAEPMGFQGTRCVFRWKNQEIRATVKIPGAHMVMNALLAVAVGIELGVSPEEITAAFEKFTPPDGRMNIIEAAEMTVINDVYNANPASMQEAIKVLVQENSRRRRVAILGDMLELGHVAEPRHRELGEFAASAGIDLLIAIGGLSRYIYEGFLAASPSGAALYFEKTSDFRPEEHLLPRDIVLLKASRGMEFERIIQWISQ